LHFKLQLAHGRRQGINTLIRSNNTRQTTTTQGEERGTTTQGEERGTTTQGEERVTTTQGKMK